MPSAINTPLLSSYSQLSIPEAAPIHSTDDVIGKGVASDNGAAEAIAGYAMTGMGAMAGRTLAVGSGALRTGVVANAVASRNLFHSAGQVLAGVMRTTLKLGFSVLATALFPLTLIASTLVAKYHSQNGALKTDNDFRMANEGMLDVLEKSGPDRLGHPSLAADRAVVDKLVAHVKGQGGTMTPGEITAYVNAGQKIATALLAQGDAEVGPNHTFKAGELSTYTEAKQPGTVTVNSHGKQTTVQSSLYTTRALGWYVMAKAARQDIMESGAPQQAGSGSGSESESESVAARPSNMATSGSFVMKDPNNAVFDFLSAAPTAGDRISTHFSERAGHDRTLRFQGSPIQRGIEDYSAKLPGQRGTMLFDKLVAKNGDKEVFIKFEAAGLPPVFQTGGSIGQVFSAIYRNYAHVVNFSKGQKKTEAASVFRQEHVLKGFLQHTVGVPFMALAKAAKEAKVSADMSDNTVSPAKLKSDIKKFGLPFVRSSLDHIEAAATKMGRMDIAEQARNVRVSMHKEMATLGVVSDRYGIERRGAEVHLSLASE